MHRRDALKRTTLLVGGVLAASSGVLGACAREERRQMVLSGEDETLITEVADTILPTTSSSPGAKAAGVGPAIDLLLTDCYTAEDQRRALDGLRQLREQSRIRSGADFTALGQGDRARLLREIDAEARAAGDTHWFHLLRELSERAYFSSETGMTQALRYVRVPGRWIGCVPLKPGQRAWA